MTERRVVVLGAGGREHAIAWACARHGHTVQIVDAPEVPAFLDALNHGTAHHPAPDLVIVGPESLLAAGAADRCAAAGVACFGPSAALARLESSKGYARELAASLGIPGPWYRTYGGPDVAGAALADWTAAGCPDIVVKQDGLAAGKGVIVPDDRASTEAALRTLGAMGPIVVEERMSGPEVTLLAVCDGVTARPLPLAQDHKRIGVGDTGANTGGMGAYAPAMPHTEGLDPEALTATFVQPIVDHFAAAGTPYVGVIYAGLMVTEAGQDSGQPCRLVEYNCRFGDPEAQAVLALVDSDLTEIALACVEGRLAGTAIATRPGTACTVVAAADGYPTAPRLGGAVALDGEPLGPGSVELTHGGVTAVLHPSGVASGVTSGGRVLSITAVGADLAEARRAAYAAMERVHFDGKYVRPDIGWRAHAAAIRTYADTGVDIDEGARAVSALAAAVQATHGPAVLRGIGSFGGAFSAAALRDLADPVLVGSTDGVGTKVELAARAGRYAGVGRDIVNHCIDDVLVQGARPLFFLDYIASSSIRAAMVADVVGGMAAACADAGCALLGGETAEMPGVYHDGAFDIAGTLVGLVERAELLPRPGAVLAGDALVGLASNGPHTNGYSLLRNLFAWLPLDAQPAPLDRPLIDALLEPHRSYLGVLGPILDDPLTKGSIKALAHITGGGLPENLPRALPDGLGAEVELGSWPVPPLFQLVRQVATLDTDELYRTVNMGIGMVAVTDRPTELIAALAARGEPSWIIGRVVPLDHGGDHGEARVTLR